jgi:hypothetical protein
LTIPTYDYDQRYWKKIYGPEELTKLGELLTDIPADEIKKQSKPTVRITTRLKAASSIYNNDKADKILRLLTGNI